MLRFYSFFELLLSVTFEQIIGTTNGFDIRVIQHRICHEKYADPQMLGGAIRKKLVLRISAFMRQLLI